jgi:type II secretory pathway component PulJ
MSAMRSRHSREEGMTLLEVTVTMLLVSIVGAMVFAYLMSIMTTTTRATKNTEAEKAITIALRTLTENVRGASAIATAYPSTTSCSTGTYPTGYPNCISLTIARPSSGQLTCPKSVVNYGLKNGVLREDRTDYHSVSNSCVVARSYTGRPLLRNVVNSTTPLFTFYDRFGNRLDPAASGQTATPFAAAVTIRVSVKVQYSQTGTSVLSYTSDLALRNNR